jgi:hypothetical protein
MIHRISRTLTLAMFLGWSLTQLGADARAADAEPAQLAPETTVAWLEVSQPELLLDQIFNRAAAYPGATEAFLGNGKLAELKTAVRLLELRLGVKWEKGLRELIGGGVYLAVDPANKTNLLMIRAKNAAFLEKFHAALVDLAELDAQNKQRPSTVKSKEYNGIKAYSMGGDEAHVILGNLLVVCDKSEGLKAAIDRHLAKESDGKSLADSKEFQQARQQLAPSPLAWGMVQLDAVRKQPNVEKLFVEKSNNPLLELVLGGILQTARDAPAVVASLHLTDDSAGNQKVSLKTYLTGDTAPAVSRRPWYFGKETADGAAKPLRPKGVIATLSTYRDVSGLWIGRDELFDDKINAGFAQADSGLGLYFSGRDFGTEVLGELTPRWQIVVARQEFAAGQPTPAVKLPAFALVLEMKKPDEFATHLQLAFQNGLSLANLGASQNGQPQFLSGTETYRGASISRGQLMLPKDAPRENGALQCNFSPASTRSGKHFIIGSTVGIVRDLIDNLQEAGATQSVAENTVLELDVEQGAAALAENQALLVSRQKLEQGGSQEEAEARVKQLFDVVRQFGKARLQLIRGAQSLSLDTTVELRPVK